jgi:hypothetical protein
MHGFHFIPVILYFLTSRNEFLKTIAGSTEYEVGVNSLKDK